MTEYVLGFVFDSTGDYVLLMKKQKPLWQKDLWNGIGGKVESEETDYDAMVREAKEEIALDHMEWLRFAILEGPDFTVAVFSAHIPVIQLQELKAQEVEPVMIFATSALPKSEMITNLRWLIPLANDPSPTLTVCSY